MKLTFIQTGGTIDKDYPHTLKGWAFEFGEPATNRILEKLNPSFDYDVVTAFQKDSLEITDDDRMALVELIGITGAMLPERFSNSDAPINLGCAIATANLMDDGVYIAMHGIVKEYVEMKRNLTTGKYY